MAQRLPAKSPASMASTGPKPQDVETPTGDMRSRRRERAPRA
jgi:hypothetical protein